MSDCPKPDRRGWTRRDFLQVASAGALAAAAAPGHAAHALDEPPLIIDCHAHIYSEDERKYPTIKEPYRPPAGTGTVEHLRREMQAAGVTFVTAIQTSTFYRWDNRFTADASRENKAFMAGVCTLNPDDPASPRKLGEFAKGFNVRGIRSIPAKNGRFDDPGVEGLWRAADRLGIVVNVLANPDQHGEIVTLVRRHPKLRIVVDHCLNIKAGDTLEPAVKAMRSLAAYPTLHAKLTFLPTGSVEKYPFRDMHEPCREVIKAFGPDRCVWGSDFPCELWCPKVTYAEHLRIFTHELDLDESSQRAILGETAKRLWFADAT